MGANVKYQEFDHETHTFGGNNLEGVDTLKDSIGKSLRHIMPKI